MQAKTKGTKAPINVTAGLLKVGFEKPSPIQLKAIPLGRCGLDLIVQAKSGTGKTCVFSVIALEGIDLSNPSTQVLVLAPTREIAVQIQDTIRAIGCEMKGLCCHVFIGGTLFGPDRQKLKKCHIAVGTPGRIKQLIEYEVLKTGTIRLFILDEADKLLDNTFQEQVNWVYNHLSDNKQMLALSATYPEYLASHLTKYMREPMFVRLNPKDLALRGIKQLYVELPGHSLPNKAFEIKVIKLLKILTQVSFTQCLIFSNLQTRAQNLCDILCDSGWPSECISGAHEQSQRLLAMARLKKFQCRILISTDLTARGIDAENVNLIINLDIPADTKTYLHRIGRAGRFGTHGAAISLASKGREIELLRNIQRQCRVKMTELPDPAPSDLLKQELHLTGFQQVSITPESLVPANEDSTTDITTFSPENNIQVKGDTIPTLTSNGLMGEYCSHKVGVNGSLSKMKDSDTFDGKPTKIVESTDDMEATCIPKTNIRVKEPRTVDVCTQTSQEDVVQLKSLTSQFEDVRSEDYRDRPTLPIGFEDAPEVRKLSLLQWSQVKSGHETRKACTWYESKESFEKYMIKKTRLQGSEGEGVDEMTKVIEHSDNDVHEIVCDSHDIIQKKFQGLTPTDEIEIYRAQLYNSFMMCSHLGKRDISKIEIENSEEATVTVRESKETEYMDNVTSVLDVSSGGIKRKGMENKQDDTLTEYTSETTKDNQESEEKITVNQDDSSGMLLHQVSNPLDSQPKNKPEIKTKPKVVSTVGWKKKGKQQRIKHHIFQMSTLGALMSPKELDIALVSNLTASLCDGDMDTDTDKQKVHKLYMTHQGQQNKAECEESPISDLSERETLKIEQATPLVQENIPLEKDSSTSTVNDPVWAIFKNYIPASLPPEAVRKDNTLSETGESSSDQSSSSLCESDTSTCSTSSSEAECASSGTDAEDKEYIKDTSDNNHRSKGKNPGTRHHYTNQVKVKVKDHSNTSDGFAYNEDSERHVKYHNPDISSNQSSNVDGWQYNESYYATAPVTGYHGWHYPGYSQHYWNDYYNEYQQPYTHYSYLTSLR
ncbi:uncharacterized protein LOC121410215 isoform X2 [Lytechinus variegatus]|uniref:uncharacterized protein LOC121410215 isoform X2 n=1 Tax=Lytechinus variegatus TaxID=7654 RepID=UPI001BB101E9|nr:uncharacterized protein LOC121410215 isoform X2 [Lytechinus variegatus]XP_041458084.1 uncharacterized protein LOC121410215 isoform X2 [Lytechinus variegatus]